VGVASSPGGLPSHVSSCLEHFPQCSFFFVIVVQICNFPESYHIARSTNRLIYFNPDIKYLDGIVGFFKWMMP